MLTLIHNSFLTYSILLDVNVLFIILKHRIKWCIKHNCDFMYEQKRQRTRLTHCQFNSNEYKKVTPARSTKHKEMNNKRILFACFELFCFFNRITEFAIYYITNSLNKIISFITYSYMHWIFHLIWIHSQRVKMRNKIKMLISIDNPILTKIIIISYNLTPFSIFCVMHYHDENQAMRTHLNIKLAHV